MATKKETPVEVPAEPESDPKQKTEERTSDRATTVQEQGIGPRDPYPTGSPPDPRGDDSDNPNQYGEQKIKTDDDTAASRK